MSGTNGTTGTSSSNLSFDSIKQSMEQMFLEAQQKNLEISQIQTEGNTKLRTAKVVPNG